jgi:cytochrome bd-type quinol oxidase subunit 1
MRVVSGIPLSYEFGVMLFGGSGVKPWLHLTAAILVALGTAISGIAIQLPASFGYTVFVCRPH